MLTTDIETAISAAKVQKIVKILVPGVHGWPEKTSKLDSFHGVFYAWGVHPCYTDKCKNVLFEANPFEAKKPIAIGECGLDNKCNLDIQTQLDIFSWQLDLAKHINIPAIVHLTCGFEKAFNLIRSKNVKVVLHSACCSFEMAMRFIDLGSFVSLSGNHLRDSKKLRKIAQNVPESSILLETDAPSGLNQNGNRPTAPSSLNAIAQKIALLRETDTKAFISKTFENSINFFNLESM